MPAFERADERAVHDFARELLIDRAVSAPTYARAVEELGLEGVVALTGILGYYGLISMTIRAFQVGVPEGESEPFAEG